MFPCSGEDHYSGFDVVAESVRCGFDFSEVSIVQRVGLFRAVERHGGDVAGPLNFQMLEFRLLHGLWLFTRNRFQRDRLLENV